MICDMLGIKLQQIFRETISTHGHLRSVGGQQVLKLDALVSPLNQREKARHYCSLCLCFSGRDLETKTFPSKLMLAGMVLWFAR